MAQTKNSNRQAIIDEIIQHIRQKLLPRGTHNYDKFIRPSELDTWARTNNLTLRDLTGISYNPLIKNYCLTDDVSINYLAHFQKDE